MSIIKDLSELSKKGVITEETFHRIKDYYDSKKESQAGKLFTVFGILGAVLVGLGIILIVAHNWYDLSVGVRTFFAFLPLVTGQIFCTYTFLRKRGNASWEESSATYLFFAIGACISLISQIYHIPGNISSLLFTWALLALPLVYIMRSSVVSLLYIVYITYYVAELGYWNENEFQSLRYWYLILGILPHYYFLYRKKPDSNFINIHNWAIPVSLAIALGSVARSNEELMFIAYMSLFGLFYLAGTIISKENLIFKNGMKVIGSLGTLVVLLILSFDWFWKNLRKSEVKIEEVLLSPEFMVAVILSVFAFVLLYFYLKNRRINETNPISLVFPLFIVTYLIGHFSVLAVVLVNLFILVVGLITIIDGIKKDHLGILNWGLLVITALVTCRFFDDNLSFIVRGALFLVVGAGFFGSNYVLLKRRRHNA